MKKATLAKLWADALHTVSDLEAECDRLREENEKLKQALTDLDQILKERWAGSA